MRPDVEGLIKKFFPEKKYHNPLDEALSFSPDHRRLVYDIITGLKRRLGREITHSSDGRYDLSEKILIRGKAVLRVSFLGPFAHLDFTEAQDFFPDDEADKMRSDIREALSRFEILLLNDEDVMEQVDWFSRGESPGADQVRVWHCLFSGY